MRAHVTMTTILLLASVGFAAAQNSPQGPDDGTFVAGPVSQIPIDLLPPGARALGMGGAFIGVADDATAAEANPAGLTILTRPEVSLHLRRSSVTIEYDNVDNQLIADFVGDSSISTVNEAEGDFANTSFISYVHPFQRWVLSAYYQESIDFEGGGTFGLTTVRGFSFLGADLVDTDVFSTRQSSLLNQKTLGLSAAFKIGDRVSIGASVRASEFDVDISTTARFEYLTFLTFGDPTLGSVPIDSLVGLAFIDRIDIATSAVGSDDDITFNVGLLFDANKQLSFGLVYKEGGSFGISGFEEGTSCLDVVIPEINFSRRCNPNTQEGDGANLFLDFFEPRVFEYELPDFAGIGLAWRPTSQWLIAFDVDYVTYSNLSPRQQDIADFPEVLEEIDDEYEYHLGIEYTHILGESNRPLSFRAGVYTEEDHDGYARIDSDDTHVTLGFGTVFDGNFQIDLAGHFSDRITEGLISGVFRF